MRQIDVHIVRVFAKPDGSGGSPLAVVLDGSSITDVTCRQSIAHELAMSETVFVDDAAHGSVDIYTPSVRLPFAGYPLLGAAWLLRERGASPDIMRSPAGEARSWTDEPFTWIRARPEWVTGKRTQSFASVDDVEALPAPPPGDGWLYAWAWLDEAGGVVRARGFPRRGDSIAEDEATGAAAILLASELKRDLHISQGKGSQLELRVPENGWIDLGGRVAFDSLRQVDTFPRD